jgi:hypothetical protein
MPSTKLDNKTRKCALTTGISHEHYKWRDKTKKGKQMPYIDKMTCVYFSLFFLSRATHINKQGGTLNVGKRKAERSQPVDPKKASWCFHWIFFSLIYLRVSADGI